MSTFRLTLICLLLVLTPAAGLDAATIRVPQDQPNIQAGMDAAVDGDTVLVADGLWQGDGNRDLDFGGRAIVVASENGYENCIIDCQGGSQNHRAFYFHSGEGPDSVIEGFTIQRGSYYGGMSSDKYGGAICSLASGFTLRDCYLQHNNSRQGGGIFAASSTVVIRNTVFFDNESEWNGGGLCMATTVCLIDGCEFVENDCATIYGGNGAAISGHGCSLSLSNTIIHRNRTAMNGDGSALSGGEAEISFCTIADNENQVWDDALVTDGIVTLSNCVIYGHPNSFYLYGDAQLTRAGGGQPLCRCR